MLKKLPLEMTEVEALKGLQNLNREHTNFSLVALYGIIIHSKVCSQLW